jgi:membrane protein DedA with SNARE-associated domain
MEYTGAILLGVIGTLVAVTCFYLFGGKIAERRAYKKEEQKRLKDKEDALKKQHDELFD